MHNEAGILVKYLDKKVKAALNKKAKAAPDSDGDAVPSEKMKQDLEPSMKKFRNLHVLATKTSKTISDEIATLKASDDPKDQVKRSELEEAQQLARDDLKLQGY